MSLIPRNRECPDCGGYVDLPFKLSSACTCPPVDCRATPEALALELDFAREARARWEAKGGLPL